MKKMGGGGKKEKRDHITFPGVSERTCCPGGMEKDIRAKGTITKLGREGGWRGDTLGKWELLGKRKRRGCKGKESS